MDIETLRDYCLGKPGATESFPFGEDTLVFKVDGKIFLLSSFSDGGKFNVKCDPERAMELRERYSEVQPGYHMNKKHWNTVNMNGRLTDSQVYEMIDQSYQLVAKNRIKNNKTK